VHWRQNLRAFEAVGKQRRQETLNYRGEETGFSAGKRDKVCKSL